MIILARSALFALGLVAGLGSFAGVASGQDRITLAEVLPVLEGSELGAIEVADAPPPGGTRVVRRSEVRSALAAAGQEARGLVIPRSVRVRREARELSREELEALVVAPISERLRPCEVEQVTVPNRVRLGQGDIEVSVDLRAPRASGRTSGFAVLTVRGRDRRIPVRAQVRCPPPAIQPGSRVRIIAVVGNVRASMVGEARQVGRVGDVIRVRSQTTRAALMARVVDSQTVLVVR